MGKLWEATRGKPLGTASDFPKDFPKLVPDRIDGGSYRPAALSRFVQSGSRDSFVEPAAPVTRKRHRPG